MADIKVVSPEEWAAQKPFIDAVAAHYAQVCGGRMPKAQVRTFGCQQNVADSQRIQGMLALMGFGFTDNPDEADLIVFNTCAVREHAQDRVFGNIGALKKWKREQPHRKLILCGCMAQQPTVAQKVKNSYPFVDMVMGTHVVHTFPELLHRMLQGRKTLVEIPSVDGVIAEGIPMIREDTYKAFIPIMYGCNNFCTYCIVPYVRGRERSRDPELIVAEARELVANGCKEITLVGQNVNSYGKGEAHGVDFPELLKRINDIEGDFLIRFMTSHPRDASKKLFDTIAACKKVERHIHLPFQSGSDRVLKAMNRHYTRAQYLDLIAYARKVIPDAVFTSDVIVGFPGETREDFEQTLSLIEEVGFISLYTFIFSPRVGTPAEKMDDPISAQEKSAWFKEMTDLQETLSEKQIKPLVGTVRKGLIDRFENGMLEVRLPENLVVRAKGEEQNVGRIATVKITEARSYLLTGEIQSIEGE